jgi:hypothetical protein
VLGLASLSKQYLLLMSYFITKRMNFVANGFAHIPFHVAVSNINEDLHGERSRNILFFVVVER